MDDVYIINPNQYNERIFEIIYSTYSEHMEQWLNNKLEKFDTSKLRTYVNGVKKDITAVKNGITFVYNNGLAEGSANKSNKTIL